MRSLGPLAATPLGAAIERAMAQQLERIDRALAWALAHAQAAWWINVADRSGVDLVELYEQEEARR
jgi:hypothetical protein